MDPIDSLLLCLTLIDNPVDIMYFYFSYKNAKAVPKIARKYIA